MSKIEVNAIEPQSGTTLTLGASGDTVTLAAGASQSGFGRSGSVNWDTTPKTSGFTAVSGNGYFVNTTAGAITVTLPITPTAGDIVAISDYANTSATNNITVGRNGSLIDGNAVNGTINVNGQVYTLVYIDATEGWKTVNQTYNQITTASFIEATGGTITTSGDFKIHSFTGPGTFTVSSVGNPFGSTTVDYLVVAGGGGGGAHVGGAGGAGGLRYSFPNPATAGFPVTAQGYPITVGSGGTSGIAPCAPNLNKGGSGNNSIFSTITSTGGGGGGADFPDGNGKTGGSGGGGGHGGASGRAGGSGNTPPVSPSQGNNGGAGTAAPSSPGYTGGGGGGANAVGTNGINSPSTTGGPGGAGLQLNIDGNNYYWAGGGGGGTASSSATAPVIGGNGGLGGGGGSGAPNGPNTGPVGTGGGSTINSGSPGSGRNGGNGGTNTGGGGGGGSEANGSGGTGGSGIVVIRYKFQ